MGKKLLVAKWEKKITWGQSELKKLFEVEMGKKKLLKTKMGKTYH